MAHAQAPFPERKPRGRPRPAPFGSVTRPLPRRLSGGQGRSLVAQLAAWFVVLSLTPLVVAGYFNYRYASNGILEDIKANLQALVTHQASEVQFFFQQAELQTIPLASSPTVRDTLTRLGNITAAQYQQYPDSTALSGIEDQWNTHFQTFVTDLPFSEIILVNLHGLVVYSTGREGSVFANLATAPDNALAIAALYRDVLQKLTLCQSGMTLATPFHRPAYYLGMPVYARDNSTEVIGVLILALDNAILLPVLNNRIGLGVSGETLVLARDQGKFIIVNTPHLQPSAAFTAVQPLRGTDKFGDGVTPPGQALVAEGIGYRNHDVLAAWIYLPALNWVLMQKVDHEEIFAPVERLREFSFAVGGVTLLLVLVVAVFVARGITRPVVELTQVAERIAQGDLSADIAVRARNEIGLLSQAVNTMARSLKSLVGKVQDSATIICTNAAQMAATSRQQTDVAQSTGAAAVEVAATAKQISATSQELTRTMEQVNGVAQDTAQRAEAGLDGLHLIQTAVTELDQARGLIADQLELIAQKAQAISAVTVTMTKVADQTNLLSLNAAIEARKAGEYGRGFSVVAREIQRLADQAAVSTLEIEHTIGEMTQAVGAGVAGMKGFSARTAASVERIQTVSQQLTEVIQQVQGLPARFEMVLQGMQSQSEGARQITGAISHMSESAQQTAAAVQDSMRLIDQLRETTRALQNEVSLFRV